ncbi:Uncharacterised protein [Mycobacterium tuberculosis]|nr:Uncharacterised protein [Mycobacterium tuberculosis]CNN04100.1 Uncharacterised protein [Mycobacterium tuberculosis]CNN27013.1 Uncharacterised protein [Mycobacterium tuberculosis]
MQVRRVHHPRDEGHRLLGVPAPVAAPGFLGPDGTEYHPEAENGEGEDRGPVGDSVQGLGIGEPPHHTRQRAFTGWLTQPRCAHKEQDAGDTGDQEYPRTEADHRHMNGQPVGLQCRHHRGGIGVEPASGHGEQDQHRDQQEDPQRPVSRTAQHDRAGDEPGQAGQVDELVHVAPRHPLGGQAAQHDARQQ